MTETMFEGPLWVVDFLPRQAPAGSAGQLFDVEGFFLREPLYTALLNRFAEILLKLNCYYDMRYGDLREDSFCDNLPPEQLAAWMTKERRDLCILIPAENALITLNRGDTHMTVYHPSETLLRLLEQLAGAAGLFVWQPPVKGSDGL